MEIKKYVYNKAKEFIKQYENKDRIIVQDNIDLYLDKTDQVRHFKGIPDEEEWAPLITDMQRMKLNELKPGMNVLIKKPYLGWSDHVIQDKYAEMVHLKIMLLRGELIIQE